MKKGLRRQTCQQARDQNQVQTCQYQQADNPFTYPAYWPGFVVLADHDFIPIEKQPQELSILYPVYSPVIGVK